MRKHRSLPVVILDSMNTEWGNYLFIFRSLAEYSRICCNYYDKEKPVCDLSRVYANRDDIIALHVAKHWPECVQDGKVAVRAHQYGGDLIRFLDVPADTELEYLVEDRSADIAEEEREFRNREMEIYHGIMAQERCY